MDPDLIAAAARVLDANRALGRMVAVAESCTGGLVAAALTEVPGSSDVFERGYVTYSNEAKMEAIGVSRDIVETFGAVSVAVAWAMAQGTIRHSHADIAVAVTGIAGPGGGSAKKPVGTVVFARAMRGGDPDIVVADIRHFGDVGRSEIRRQAALVALDLLMPETR
ncbi:CinA family protein [Polymorphobacter fuscus]|uniref:Nicotinamide-nucleotide amidohydrolase family protein n=1 Tax=Sandarakinorhabdus fusca TaxID=1439888 RepID=A0A7C9LF50_9SPHN|nr:CinA family protein [Polymorphobacter fuscus]KAB7648863.1 CinA family protein [Polymorphobacter fuscus]MQT16447.1 nicotinamide-nucleotide amidohydrolase family protein [Polymorphobacter fuscus]NJC07263.1 nicotinamide-nucleotide amidase [Polymorphobacter fuscus]